MKLTEYTPEHLAQVYGRNLTECGVGYQVHGE